jgi:hypothetical protein
MELLSAFQIVPASFSHFCEGAAEKFSSCRYNELQDFEAIEGGRRIS